MGGALWEERERSEGNWPAHSGSGSLLSSHADHPPSRAPPGCVGPWGHRREDEEIRRDKQEGPSQTPDWRSRRGEESVCPAHSSTGSLLGSQVMSPDL